MIGKIKASIKNLLPRNTFARGVSVLFGGAAGAQLLVVLVTPFLTRIYSAADFGLLAVYAGLLALIGVVASLRYELAIPLPETDEEAAHLLVLSLLIVLSMTAMSAIATAIFGARIANALDVPKLIDYLWLLPVGVLLSGAYNVFNYWAVRTKSFTTIAGAKIHQATVSIIIQLVAFKLGGIALLLAQVAGQSVGGSTLFREALRSSASFKLVRWKGVVSVAMRYSNFPFYSSGSALINSLSWQLPVLLLGFFFTTAAVGFYAFSLKILQAPLSIVSGAVSQAFYPEATKARAAGKSGDLVIAVFNKLAFFALVPTVTLLLFGQELFAFAFGKSWAPAGQYAQLLCVWFFIWFVSSPLSATVLVYERMDLEFVLSLVAFVLRLLAVLLGGLIGDSLVTIFMISIAGVVGHGSLLYVVFKLSGLKLADVRVSVLSILIRSLPTCFVLCTLRIFIENHGLIFIAVTVTILTHFFVNKNFLSK